MECNICLQSKDNVAKICDCTLRYCRECFSKILKKGKCPQCRTELKMNDELKNKEKKVIVFYKIHGKNCFCCIKLLMVILYLINISLEIVSYSNKNKFTWFYFEKNIEILICLSVLFRATYLTMTLISYYEINNTYLEYSNDYKIYNSITIASIILGTILNIIAFINQIYIPCIQELIHFVMMIIFGSLFLIIIKIDETERDFTTILCQLFYTSFYCITFYDVFLFSYAMRNNKINKDIDSEIMRIVMYVLYPLFKIIVLIIKINVQNCYSLSTSSLIRDIKSGDIDYLWYLIMQSIMEILTILIEIIIMEYCGYFLLMDVLISHSIMIVFGIGAGLYLLIICICDLIIGLFNYLCIKVEREVPVDENKIYDDLFARNKVEIIVGDSN